MAAASADDCLLASASAADDVGDALAAAAAAAAASGVGGERTSSRRNSASCGAVPAGPLGYRRTRFVVVPLDGEHGAAAAAAAVVAFAAAIEAGEQARAAAFFDAGGDDDDGGELRATPPPPPPPGLGVVSLLGFDLSARLLAERGAPLDALDWIVCHAGADIWHAHSHCEVAGGPFDADGDAQRPSSAAGASGNATSATTPTNNTCPPGATHRWAADDAWEEHIGAGWDRASVARLVVKVLKPSPLASLGDTGLLGALAGAGGVIEDNNKDGAHAAAAAAGAAAAEVDDQSLAALLRTLDELSPAGRTHPHHVLLDLDRETSRAVAAAARAAAAVAGSSGGSSSAAASMPSKATTEEVALSVVDRLRRRMRANGYRAHMTLEAVPIPTEKKKSADRGEEEDAVAGGNNVSSSSSSLTKKKPSAVSARLHITPLRASRALALRFLACRFGLTMDDFTVVGLPPAVKLVPESAAVATKRRKLAAEEGGGEQSEAEEGLEEEIDPCYDVTPRTSDLVELASGACAVRILEPPSDKDGEEAEIFAAAASSPLLSRLEFRIDPDDFGRRVRLLRGGGSSAGTSAASSASSSLALAAAEVVSVPPPAPTPLAGPSPRASADSEFRLPPAGSSGAGGGGTTTTAAAVFSSAASAVASAAAFGSTSSSSTTAASSLKQKAAAAAAAAVKRATRLLSTLEETRDGNVWKH